MRFAYRAILLSFSDRRKLRKARLYVRQNKYDMVLLSQDAEGLAMMQQTMDMVTAGFGLRISASTTEILSVAAADA
jgi:ubiquinone/menaquinone biosynthesis C-methylase UbiE